MGEASPRPWSRRAWASALVGVVGPLGGYGLAALALTARAWLSPASVWAGLPGDPKKFMEFIAWYAHAVTTGGNPLHNTALNPPTGVNMMWDTTIPLPAVLVSPVTLLAGPIASYNLILLLGLALDGYCAYRWLRRHVSSWWSAFAGGLLFEVSPYVATRATEHLNLVLVFGVPLLLIAFEEIVCVQRRRFWVAGGLAGVAAAVQLLSAEEPVAFAVVAAVTALILMVVQRSAGVRLRALYALKASLVAVAVAAALCGPFLAYQFLGPGHISGPIEVPGLWVANATNLVIPNSTALLRLGSLDEYAAAWPGGGVTSVEANAYLGIPVLALLLWTTWRYRHDWVTRTVAATALVALVLSFGSSLHIGTHVLDVPLPGALLGNIPVVDQLLPARFAVIVDLGCAWLFARFVDDFRGVRWRPHQLAAAGLALLALASWIPAFPQAATADTSPQYFERGGDVDKLASHTGLLVLPYVDGDSMLWQAVSGIHFVAAQGLVILAKPDGEPTFFTPGAIDDAYRSIELNHTLPPEDSATRDRVLSQLHAEHIAAIVVGPSTGSDLEASFTTWLVGSGPRADQGVEIWQVPS